MATKQAFDLKKWMENSTATSGVPLKVQDKTVLREIARRLKVSK
jgi:hypothetical protein